MANSKKFYLFAIMIITTLGFSISLQNIIAWTVPTLTPPDNNIPAPVNVGTTTQSKDGNLLVKGFSATSSLIAGNEVITGTLGIGTTTPLSVLHIFGNSASGLTIDSGTGPASSSYINLLRGGNYTNRWEIGWDRATIGGTDDNLYFYNQSAGRLLNLTQSGNVGIGTTSPNYKLEVAGGIYSTGQIYSAGIPVSGCVLKAYSGGTTTCPFGYYVTAMTDTAVPVTGSMVCCTVTDSL